MRRGLRRNWALVLRLGLAGDSGQVTSPPYVSDPLTYHMGVPPVTSQCASKQSLNKKVDGEELPERHVRSARGGAHSRHHSPLLSPGQTSLTDHSSFFPRMWTCLRAPLRP